MTGMVVCAGVRIKSKLSQARYCDSMLEAYQQVHVMSCHVNQCLYPLLCISLLVCLVCLRFCWEVCFSVSQCEQLQCAVSCRNTPRPTGTHYNALQCDTFSILAWLNSAIHDVSHSHMTVQAAAAPSSRRDALSSAAAQNLSHSCVTIFIYV